MRLVTYRTASGTQAGRLEGDDVVALPYEDVAALMASGDDWQERAAGNGERHALADLSLAPVITKPSKIFCVGLNYLLHIQEGRAGIEQPKFPTFFAKF